MIQQEKTNKRLEKLKSESVYQSQSEALQDLNRLIKLQDFKGLKLRVMQIYKEREEQERIIEEQQEIMV